MSGRPGPVLRALLVIALLTSIVAAVLTVTADGEGGGANASAGPERASSTLERTLIDADRNGTLEAGPGEPLIDRGELAPTVPAGAELARFSQITDPHVRDEESPARAPLLDRLEPRLNSTFRPQEALSPQVLAAIVESVNRTNPDSVVVTGDLIDSAQRNELDQALAILGGGEVAPDSGGPGYDGLQDASNPDPFIYRPDLDAPRHPGLLEAAQEPFPSPGLDARWFPVLGNHDLLVQGEVPSSPALRRLATGEELLATIDPNFKLPPGIETLSPELVAAVLGGGLPGKTDAVPADPGRAYLEPGELIGELTAASGLGELAGGERASADGRLDYSFELAPGVRGIVLDVVDRDGGSAGRSAPGQAQWLARELAAAERDGEPVLIFSHQPLQSSVGGESLLEALDGSDGVVAAISGHTHRNSIEPRRTPAGGYWLISTASLADYPQQARTFRLLEAEGGGLVLETWMLDVAPERLADISRELAFLDFQGGRPQGNSGEASDRNARLFLPAPTG